MSEMNRDDALRLSIRDRVLRRAVEDEEFRRLLMDNPKSAIARELGIDVPEGVHVTVLSESPNHIFVVLPSAPDHPQQPIVTGFERLASDRGLSVPAYGGGGGGHPNNK